MANISALEKLIERRIQKKVDDALKAAKPKIWEDAKKELRDIYDKATQEFYDAYDPSVYDRNRSLTEGDGLLRFHEEDDKYSADFDPQSITPTHKGDHNFIYEAVFVGGFHGGPVWPWFDPPRPAEHSTSPLLSIREEWDKRKKNVLEPKLEKYIKEYLEDVGI